MSSKNEDNGAIVAIGLVMAGAYFLFVAVFVVAACAAFVLTIFSLMAWRRPISIAGLPIDPEEAHVFVKGGLAGALMTPLFLALVSVLLNTSFNDRYFVHFLIGGYIIGSFGFEIILQKSRENAAAVAASLPQILPKPERHIEASSEHQFRFARWDDEDERQ